VEVCSGFETKVGGEATGGVPPYTYSWKPTAGLSDAFVPTPTVFPKETKAYVVTVNDAKGCSASDTVTVFVHPNPKVIAGKNVQVCKGSSVQIGQGVTGGKTPYSYHWLPATGLDRTNILQPFATPTVTTTYVLMVTDAFGCVGADSLIVTVLDPPHVDIGQDTSLCIGEKVKMRARIDGGKPPYRYHWSPSTGLNSTKISEPELRAPAKSTMYILTISDANGCQSEDSVFIDVYSKPKSDAGRDTIICPGSSVGIGSAAIDGTPPYHYTWSPMVGLDAADVVSPRASPQETTTYSVTVTDANGCTDQSHVTIQVNNVLIARSGKDIHVCFGESVTLQGIAHGGQKPFFFSWKPETGLLSPRSEKTEAQPETTTTYFFSVIDAVGCVAEDSVVVTVHPQLSLQIFGPVAVCQGEKVELKAKASGGVPPYQFQWEPKKAFTSSSSNALVTTLLERETTYIITATDAAGCRISAQTTVAINDRPAPVITASGSLSFCDGDSVLLSAGVGYSEYLWSTGATTSMIAATKSGSYTVRVTNNNGCSAISKAIDVKKKVKPQPRISVRGGTRICAGDKVTLDAGGGYASYRWSSGETSRRIEVSESGDYSVVVTTRDGCREESIPVSITVIPVIIPEIELHADTIQASSATLYQWFRNGKILRGERGQFLVVKEDGRYFVETTNEIHCSGRSREVVIQNSPSKSKHVK